MPPELTGWLPQFGAVGLLLTLAVMSILGRGVVGRKFYDERTSDLRRANDTNASLVEQVGKLAAAQERSNESLREILAWIHSRDRTSP